MDRLEFVRALPWVEPIVINWSDADELFEGLCVARGHEHPRARSSPLVELSSMQRPHSIRIFTLASAAWRAQRHL